MPHVLLVHEATPDPRPTYLPCLSSQTCLDPEGVPLNMGEDPDMFGCGGRGHCPANYTCMVSFALKLCYHRKHTEGNTLNRACDAGFKQCGLSTRHGCCS